MYFRLNVEVKNDFKLFSIMNFLHFSEFFWIFFMFYAYSWLNTVIHSSPVVSRCIIFKSPIWSNSYFLRLPIISRDLFSLPITCFQFHIFWSHCISIGAIGDGENDSDRCKGFKNGAYHRVHLSNNNLLSF